MLNRYPMLQQHLSPLSPTLPSSASPRAPGGRATGSRPQSKRHAVHVPQRHVCLGFTPDPVREGAHLCFLFNDERERKRLVSAFVQAGIDEGDAVEYLTDFDSPGLLAQEFRALSAPRNTNGRDGQVEFSSAVKTLCPDGEFVPDRMIAHLRDFHTRAHAAGHAGARTTIEMSWVQRGCPGSERLMDYEASLNLLVETCPVTMICQYDARRFDGSTVFDVLNSHPLMIVRGRVVRNPYFLAARQATLERDETLVSENS